jgi:superfamily II DNA or RNA helicase
MTRDGKTARRIIRQAEELSARVRRADVRLRAVLQGVYDAHTRLIDAQVRQELERMPLSVMSTVSTDRIPVSPLRSAGMTSMADVASWTPGMLMRLHGIGEVSATAITAAVRTLKESTAAEVSARIPFTPGEPAATELVLALGRYERAQVAMGDDAAAIADLTTRLPQALNLVAPLRHPLRALIALPSTKRRAWDAVLTLGDLLSWAERRGFTARLTAIVEAIRADPIDPWADFAARASDYYALLNLFVPTTAPPDLEQGHLTADLVTAIEAQPLDLAYARVHLRGYQAFGARFLLTQRRVILGDEMGLGKTIEALAALCHLRLSDAGPVLVVCPAAVIVNWEREILARTSLAAVIIHGPDRQSDIAQWLTEGAIGITSYDTLRRLDLPVGFRLSVLIADEAHYVKNPEAARTKAVARLAGRAGYVWFLTGTPMENRVDEFVTLITHLHTDVVLPSVLPRGPEAFRKAVAPVYLRRNASDVLVELPPRIESEDWVELSRSDRQFYNAAVAEGNLMAMRMGIFRGDAKLDRITDLLEEAHDNGLKVVVYSYFHEVINRVLAAAGQGEVPCLGPIDGSVPPPRRQEIIDSFSGVVGPATLVAQIQAGGIGVNLQAASVVILCEPQLTPTSEEQAIARTHRMGQVRPVQVHRILAAGTIDEAIVTLLARKRTDFSDYARRSDLAERTDAAVDVAIPDLARQLVATEQARLARATAPQERAALEA